MSKTYYTHQRREIATLLPACPGRVLDVGCGAGETLRWLKDTHPEIETTGVEYSPEMGETLRGNADHAHIGPVDDILPSLGTYDTILCLDVLEHLPNADATLKALTGRLNPQGCIIVSLPNIAHLSVSLPLLTKRRFHYKDAGILDRTHLRFFVESSIISFVNQAGLSIEAGRLAGMEGPRSKLVDALSFGLMKHHLTKQYVFRARPSSGPQPPIDWIRL